jgi:hypothetical protein
MTGDRRRLAVARRPRATIIACATLARISQTIISDVMIGGQSKMVARVDAAKRERA